MTDETGVPTPDQPAQAPAEPAAPAPVGGPIPGAADSPDVAAAWSSVVTRMAELGDAVAAWARAAADDPDNRKHLDEVRRGVNEMAARATTAFNDATSSDIGQQVTEGAQQAGQAIGDTAQKVSDAAAPHVASAFAGLADVFGRAAARVDEAVKRQETSGESSSTAPPAEPPSSDPQP